MAFGEIEDPTSEAERHAIAEMCTSELELTMPAVVDRIDDEVSIAYHGWPERLYLVGKDGKIAYAGGPGPFQFEPDELERAIRKAVRKPGGRSIR